jgi:pyrroline-5-carboxylate reductase
VNLKGRKDTIVLSIMAGVPIEDIEKELQSNRVIRSMPNTPAMALEGAE